MNSKRQNQIANSIKKEFSEILRLECTHIIPPHVLVSVTNVTVTPDLSVARIYLSIFNTDRASIVMDAIQNNHSELKRSLAKKIRNFRRMPEIEFYLDDSLEQAQKIDDIFRTIKRDDENTEG